MIFTTYYDASGDQESLSGALVVVGLASTQERWLRFEREWNAVLADYGVPYFHMKEYAHSRGPFTSWKGDAERRAEFMDRLIRILKRRVNKVFSTGVILADYHIVNQDYLLAETFGANQPDAGAFSLCAETCKGLVTGWMREKHPRDRMGHVFESGDRGRGSFESLVRRDDVGSSAAVTFLPKISPTDGTRVRQFEGADLVAWEYRNLYVKAGEEGRLPQRQSLAALQRLLPDESGIHHEETLRAMCEAEPVLIPRRH